MLKFDKALCLLTKVTESSEQKKNIYKKGKNSQGSLGISRDTEKFLYCCAYSMDGAKKKKSVRETWEYM